MGRILAAGIALVLLSLSPAHAASAKDTPSPFIFAPSATAPEPSRGWVVLLPGENELAFKAITSHYEKVALLLNANGFDTLIVPYEDAYDEDLDGDPDSDGDRIAAVTLRAVHWMRAVHPETETAPGAVVAWGEGAQGLWSLAAAGTSYPIAELTTAVTFYPIFGSDQLFSSRIPILVQVGDGERDLHVLRHFLGYRAEGSVEPEFVMYENAGHAFDVERFVKPKTVRSVPLVGSTVTFAYNAIAAREANQKMLTFLKSRLEAPE